LADAENVVFAPSHRTRETIQLLQRETSSLLICGR